MMLSTKKFEREPGDMVRNPQQVFDGAEEMAQLFMERLERINLAQLELEDTFMGSAEYSIDGLLDSMDWREVPPLAAAMAGNSMANTRAPASAGQLLGVKVRGKDERDARRGHWFHQRHSCVAMIEHGW